MTSCLRRLGVVGALAMAVVVAVVLVAGGVLSGGAMGGLAWAQGPTPTGMPPQAYERAGQTPQATALATPGKPFVADDPYPTNMPFVEYRVPLWRFDINNDGLVTVTDATMISRYQSGWYLNWPAPVVPTPTPCATCAAGECTPQPSSTPQPTYTPEAMRVTEAQGVDFVNGIQTAVIFLGIGIACLVALVFGTVLLFWNKGRH